MKKSRFGFVLGLFLLSALTTAHAQTPPSRTVQLSWELPVLAVDGTALTGQQALTKVQVFLNVVPIQDTSSMQPTLELGAGVLTTTQTFPVAVGGTLHARVKVCNVTGCSAFSGQVTRTFPAAVPGVPTNVQITIVNQE